MEEIVFIILQIVISISVVAGVLVWLLRGLVCRSHHEPTGKAVLITGCDTGIGHEVARHLDMLGLWVFAGCENTASEGAQRLRVEASARLQLVNMDVRQEHQVEMAVRYIQDNLPADCNGLWAVINNAGLCVCGEFDWQTLEQIRAQLDTNLRGSLNVTKLTLPLLKQGQGRLINVSSVAASHPYPGLSVYTATKHALEGFSQVIRLELAKFGVQVVTIQPGDFSKATNLLNNHHKNMNLMWGEMTDINREEYKQFFLAYHDTVAKSGFTGHRIKPISVLPQSLLAGFEVAVLSKVAQHNYRIMPTFLSNIKMIIMDLLPSSLVQSFIMRRYTKSIPPLSFKYENYKSTMNL